jgi:hypothetical protein
MVTSSRRTGKEDDCSTTVDTKTQRDTNPRPQTIHTRPSLGESSSTKHAAPPNRNTKRRQTPSLHAKQPYARLHQAIHILRVRGSRRGKLGRVYGGTGELRGG